MKRLWWAAGPVVLWLAGCASPSPVATSPSLPSQTAPRPQQICNPQAAQWAVGKTNSAKTIEEARKRSGALMARVLRPGMPVTMDHNVERLNLQVDATQRITAATCG